MLVALLNLTGLDYDGSDEPIEPTVRPIVSHIVAIGEDPDGDTFVDVPGHRYFVKETVDEVTQQLFELVSMINGAGVDDD